MKNKSVGHSIWKQKTGASVFTCNRIIDCVVPENIHTPPPAHRGSQKSGGVWGSERVKFLKGRGVLKGFFPVAEMRLNECYDHTLLIDSGNQTNRNAPSSVEINVRFFVIYFPFFFRHRTTDGNPKHLGCWTSS